MAFCGDTCTVTGTEFANVEAHSFTIDLGSNEVDVRSFDSANEYGNYIACNKNGTVSVNTYLRPNMDVGDSVTFLASVNSESWSVDCIVTGINHNIDSKGVGEFTVNMRVVDTPKFT